MGKNAAKTKTGGILGWIERAGNKLPSPATLFASLFVFTAVLSFFMSMMGVSGIHPTTGELVEVNNFFSREGIVWFVKNMVGNFTGYAPLGLVLVMTAGIGMLEQTGMVNVLLTKTMTNIPAKLVPFGISFIAICGNLFSDAASVVMPPLGALAFIGVGKNPIAGMLCAFLGSSGGFSANLVIAGTDALLAGITNEVITGFFGPDVYSVEVVCNWYFMIAATFLLALVISLLDQFILEPRLGKYVPGRGSTGEVVEIAEVKPEEEKALKKAGLAALAYILLIVVGIWTRVLSNPDGTILSSPFLAGIIPLLFGLFFVTGLTYGIAVGNIKTEKDVAAKMTGQMKTMASFIIFMLISAQFISLFQWSKIGTILSIAGAQFLEKTGITGLPMICCFTVICALINLLMTSGSAKWTILGPIFVPMFALLGYDPAFTQLAFRIGDSCTNACSPMSAYLFMILSLAQEKYDKDVQLGTLLACQVPCCFIMLICWLAFLVVYCSLGLPLGPGSQMMLPAEVFALIAG